MLSLYATWYINEVMLLFAKVIFFKIVAVISFLDSGLSIAGALEESLHLPVPSEAG